MRVLGLDPGLALTGYGVIQELSSGELCLLEYGVIATAADLPTAERLLEIARQFDILLQRHTPDVVAIEELFFARNVTTALVVGEARGVLILGAARAGVPVVEYRPMEIKQAVAGYGKAPKTQVQEMVRMLLNLDHIPQPDDAADGVAVAVCHIHHRRLATLLKEAEG